MVTRLRLRIVLLLLVLPSSACMRGIIYTDVTYPLISNFNGTPVSEKVGIAQSDEVRIPLTRGSLNAAWSTRAIADAARQGGLTKVHYADERTLEILLGVWRRRTIQVYGE